MRIIKLLRQREYWSEYSQGKKSLENWHSVATKRSGRGYSGMTGHTFATLVILIFTGIVSAAPAPTGNPATYGLVPPEVANRLATLASTPEAEAVVKAAREKLFAKPDALPRIHVEGTLPHQGIYDQSKVALGDWDDMIQFALAWRVTKDKAFLQAFTRYLDAWLEIYRASFNPIDETKFDQVIVAYDLAGPDLPSETQAKMKAFLAPFADRYLATSVKGGIWVNNWQSHRVKLGTISAFALGDAALIERAHQALLRQIAINLRPDGSVLDFYDRDALHYVTYDLAPLCVTVLAAKTHGLDWFHATSPKGASIPLALDWLVPYAIGEKKHVEFVHSKVAFDAARAKAGLPGYSGEWEPKNSASLYALAAQIDPKYQAVYDTVLKNKDASTPDWLKLLIVAGL